MAIIMAFFKEKKCDMLISIVVTIIIIFFFL